MDKIITEKNTFLIDNRNDLNNIVIGDFIILFHHHIIANKSESDEFTSFKFSNKNMCSVSNIKKVDVPNDNELKIWNILSNEKELANDSKKYLKDNYSKTIIRNSDIPKLN